MLKPNRTECDGRKSYEQYAHKTEKDLEVQLVLAFVLGVLALLTFCVGVVPS